MTDDITREAILTSNEAMKRLTTYFRDVFPGSGSHPTLDGVILLLDRSNTLARQIDTKRGKTVAQNRGSGGSHVDRPDARVPQNGDDQRDPTP